jgi:ABC-type transport system involved in multi-copper enzyme maturation permease subunit
MIRLLKIEWEKVRSYRAFWVMTGLYLFMLFSVIFGLPAFLDYLASHAGNDETLKAVKSIVFNFPDIWQNIAYVAGMRGFIKIILAIIVVIFISNEFTLLTIRTNILNGMSRTEFLIAKLEFVFLLALLSTFIVFLSGLYLGLNNSPVTNLSAILGKIQFLPAYFLEVFTYLIFALLIGTLVKKTGFSVILLLLYIIIEPIIQNYLPDSFHKYLPLNAMNGVIWSGNTSYLQIKTPEINISLQQYISWGDAGICFSYAVLFTVILYFYLKRKDL